MRGFWNKCTKLPNGCWEWTGGYTQKGYGRTNTSILGKKRRWYAHRLAYTLIKGPIPQGMQVMHSCDNPKCINPEHLSVGTNQDNVNDMIAKGRQCRGEAHKSTKLTDEQVRRILADPRRQEDIAQEYGVSQPLISRLKRGKRRTFVDKTLSNAV